MAQTALPLKKKGAGLNQVIAKTHKLGGQLMGLQITNGNLIAICFSAIQITAGIVVFGWQSMSWVALILIPICAPLAVLIERLSLGGLMVFRTAGRDKSALEDDYHVGHLEKDATPKEKYEYERKRKRLKKDRWMSGFLISLGVFISGYVGDQFWQTIFRPVGEPNSTLLSVLIAGSVSLTFVFSELYAQLSNEGIKEAIQDNEITRAVLAGSEEDLKLELSMEAFGNLRSDPAKRAAVVDKIESGLTTRLLGFADRAEYLLSDGEHDSSGETSEQLIAARSESAQMIAANQTVLIQEIQEMKQIVQAKAEQASETEQGQGETDGQQDETERQPEQPEPTVAKYEDYRDYLVGEFAAGREPTVNELMRQAKRPRSTCGRWLAKARREVEASKTSHEASTEQLRETDEPTTGGLEQTEKTGGLEQTEKTGGLEQTEKTGEFEQEPRRRLSPELERELSNPNDPYFLEAGLNFLKRRYGGKNSETGETSHDSGELEVVSGELVDEFVPEQEEQ